MSIRATVRVTGAAKNTVTKLLADLGQACVDHEGAVMVNLPSTWVECEELADEAIEDNPYDQTRRETFELELMEDGRSEEGGAIDLDAEGEHHDSK